jgi:hypothetical protein
LTVDGVDVTSATDVLPDLIPVGGEIILASENVEKVFFTFRPFDNGIAGYASIALPGCASLSTLSSTGGSSLRDSEGLWQCEYEYTEGDSIRAYPEITHTPFNTKDFDYSYGLEAYVLIYARGVVGNESVVYAEHVFGIIGQLGPEEVMTLDMSNYHKEYDWPEAWQMLILCGVLTGFLFIMFCFCFWLHNSSFARKEVGLPESLQVRHAVIRQSNKKSKEEAMRQAAVPIKLGGLMGQLEATASRDTIIRASTLSSPPAGGMSVEHTNTSVSFSQSTTFQDDSVLARIQAETTEIERLRAQLSSSKMQRQSIERDLSTRAIARVQSPATRIVNAATIVSQHSSNPAVGMYKELLEMAMADGEMDDSESRKLEDFREKHDISYQLHTELVAQLRGGLYSMSGTSTSHTASHTATHTHTHTQAASSVVTAGEVSTSSPSGGSRSLQKRPSSANEYLAHATAEKRLNLGQVQGPAPTEDWDVSPPQSHTGDREHTFTFAAAAEDTQVSVPAGATVTVTTHEEEVGSNMTQEEALARLSVKAEDI